MLDSWIGQETFSKGCNIDTDSPSVTISLMENTYNGINVINGINNGNTNNNSKSLIPCL